jgi:uncharacterized protein (DUF305 family)
MTVRSGSCAALTLATVAVLAGCASGGGSAPARAPLPASAPPAVVVRTDSAAIARARRDSLRLPYTEMDVRFMTNMIGHHAQAIEMSRMAPSRNAGPGVRRLAERIINAQLDEIVVMQQWLADRQRPFPQVHAHDGAEHAMHHGTPGHEAHAAGGQDQHHMMPGMLTEAQMLELSAARGKTFDRLFLTYMIQHHRGAVAMVKELFGTVGAGQDELVFKFASDVNVDQSTEIARMEQMLATMQP